jgi:ABC-2 type transport system permease protein
MIKIVKKKSFLVILIIAFLFVILNNFLTLKIDSLIDALDSVSETEYQSLKEMYDNGEKSAAFLEEYSAIKTYHDYNEIRNKYNKDSWQYGYLDMNNADYENNDGLYEIINNINSYELGISNDKEAYEDNKKKYDRIINDLNNDDWKVLVQNNIKSLETELNSIEEEIKGIEEMASELNWTESEKVKNLKAVELNKKSILLFIEKNKYRLDHDIHYGHKLNGTLIEYYNSKSAILNYEEQDISKLEGSELTQYSDYRKMEVESKYKLDNNIVDTTVTNKEMIEGLFDNYSFIIMIFILMVSGSIVSQEFSKGTIKLLLIKPYSRTKILLSKYLAFVSSLLLMTVIILIFQIVVGGLFLDFSSLSDPVFYYSSVSDKVISVNVFVYFLKSFVATLPTLLFIGTVSFAASTIFTNTALAVITGFAASSGINIVTSVLKSSLETKWWAKFFIGFHIDFSNYIFGMKPIIKSFTPMFSICVYLVYFIIIMAITFVFFKKRDIKNV